MRLKRTVLRPLSAVMAIACCGVMAAELQQSPTTPAVAQVAATQPAGQPSITLDAAEHDFGQVRTGEKVEHRFKITNSGSAELRVRNGAA